MNILPLPNSHAPVKELKVAIEELERFFKEYLTPVDENGGRIKDCENGNCCLLEFFYYFDPTPKYFDGYKNGIWIRVNKKKIWLYVHVNDYNKKKVSIFSQKNLHCKNFPQQQNKTYRLPPNFIGPLAFYEKLWVADMDYHVLIQEIIRRLPCVCKAKI